MRTYRAMPRLHHRLNAKTSLSPHRLPSDARPFAGLQERKELGNLSRVFDFPHKTAQRMPLPGSRAEAVCFHLPQATLHDPYLLRLPPKSFKVQIQRTTLIKTAQIRDPVAKPAQQNRELRAVHHLALELQLGGR